MPLFSEHISNMYYSGSPSYTSPSYGYKSSYNPLGTSYSASYLSPGGSYSKHSSLSSYSRAPLTSHRWIPGISRSYSPMLTPISERGSASPIRINSPRRIPIAKRSYGSSSYIQRPININTESIDVSKDRYRSKPEEPPSKVSLPKPEDDEPIKDNGNSPFMPRVDGKPETGIDSSPGMQRSTIKRGRTVVRLHTIKRKDKDSPRKPYDTPQLQDKEIKNADAPKSLENDAVPDEPKAPLKWREKLSDDLIYVDKRDKKSLGTKLVEKFLVAEKDNKADKSEMKSGEVICNISGMKSGEVISNITPEVLSIKHEVASTSKSPDRRYSLELLAEQSSLFDSLIRGENLSTATLDLSKVGIADESKNKLVSSNSIKRKKTDDKGNPLKTTKSDHSLHDSINKSLKGNKDSKVFTKRRSLKKSQSGGSIHRLDSITELPKESVHVDLPAIEENRFSPKETKSEHKTKPRNKITATVEVSPPTSPLKFRIENVVVEEKLHKPKKEISFSYDVEETPVQEVTVQGPKSTLKRCKERNSVKKKSKKIIGTEPTSPEPDDGNFWAKIGKRETVYLIHRKKNIEAAREENKKSNFWFNEEEESKDNRDASVTDKFDVLTVNRSDSISQLSSDTVNSDLLLDSEQHNKPSDVGKIKKGVLKTIPSKLDKSKSSDNIEKINSNTHNTSLKEKKTKPVAELKHDDHVAVENKTTHNAVLRQDAEIKEPVLFSGEKSKNKNSSGFNLSLTESNVEKATPISETKSDLDTRLAKSEEVIKIIVPKNETTCTDGKSNASTDLDKNLLRSKEMSNTCSPLESLTEANETLVSNTQAKIIDKSDKKESNTIAVKIETVKPNIGNDLCEENSTEKKTFLLVTEIEANIDQSGGKNSNLTPENMVIVETNKATIGDNLLTKIEIKPVNTIPIIQGLVKSKGKENDLVITPEVSTTIDNSTINVGLKILVETKPTAVDATIKETQVQCIDKDSTPMLEKIETTKPILITERKIAVPLSTVTHTESKDKVNSVSSLQAQAKRKIESKQSESLTKHKPMETVENIESNVSKSINPESKKKSIPRQETNEVNSKKKVKKVQVKGSEKNKEIKTENISSPKENIICDTCKKSLSSGSLANTNKLILTKVVPPLFLKQLQEKDKAIKINSTADKPIDNVQLAELDNSAANSSNSNTPLETSVSTSQMPLVIETKDIPNNTSDTNQLETSETPQEKTGEENKADIDTKRDEDNKLKQRSIKEAKLKKPIKVERPVKPLIATPRPLLKRAPQVIHSDSSDSSSEEESSEEESDTSENSTEFYECENNPDGRTSTGSNDSGFDSSAPASPASFLQIKKGADSPGPSSSNASAQLPATDVVDSELELEQSTAYGLFRKTGRFTPPARSIPRFRKYNIEDFQFIKVLGKGSFGKVLLAELRDTEYYYAVKCLKKDVVLEDDDVECTLIERKVLALGTNHPYLCHLFATFQTDSHLFFVMEYLNGGDLMFHIQQSGRFPEPRARFYAGEIVSGLKFLHKRGIVYRDLKLDNILLDFDGHVRIADFGMCKLQIYLDKTADTFCGTPDYMAPEIIKGLKYNQAVDWWSFGVLLYEMLIGQSPFSGCDEDELFWSICNEMPSYPRFLSRESLTILTRLLDKDAKTRLGGTECMHGDIREQDFFHPVHWDKLERRELETPFKPRVRHPLDTQYFDRAFTGERPRLTAVEPHVLRSMDQEPFRGFSYTNPNATDR